MVSLFNNEKLYYFEAITNERGEISAWYSAGKLEASDRGCGFPNQVLPTYDSNWIMRFECYQFLDSSAPFRNVTCNFHAHQNSHHHILLHLGQQSYRFTDNTSSVEPLDLPRLSGHVPSGDGFDDIELNRPKHENPSEASSPKGNKPPTPDHALPCAPMSLELRTDRMSVAYLLQTPTKANSQNKLSMPPKKGRPDLHPTRRSLRLRKARA